MKHPCLKKPHIRDSLQNVAKLAYDTLFTRFPEIWLYI